MRKIHTNSNLCSGCKACSIACAIAHTGIADTSKGAIQIQRDARAEYETQSVCRQCEVPECVAACMAAALSTDPETGRVLFNRDKCVGCWMCVMVCPHRGIVRDPKAGKAIRCDQCVDKDVPACVAACATAAVQVDESD